MTEARPPLRDDLLLVAASLGAVFVLYVPGVWLVVGRSSPELLAFLVLQQLEYAVTAVALMLALRLLGRRGLPALPLLTAAICVAVALGLGPSVDAYALRIGIVAEHWTSRALGVWNTVLLAIFLVWAREGRARQRAAAQRLRGVQQAQLAARRTVVEAQLRAVQARVDPAQVFAALDAVERLQASDAPAAEALFDALVRYLRAAVPSVDSETSTLAHELELAAASVRMQALAMQRELRLDAAVDAPLRAAEFPPGVLLPLVAGVLEAQAGPARLALAVRQAGSRLVLEFGAPWAPPEARLRQAQESLWARHGGAATLRCALLAEARARVRIEVPYGCR